MYDSASRSSRRKQLSQKRRRKSAKASRKKKAQRAQRKPQERVGPLVRMSYIATQIRYRKWASGY